MIHGKKHEGAESKMMEKHEMMMEKKMGKEKESKSHMKAMALKAKRNKKKGC